MRKILKRQKPVVLKRKDTEGIALNVVEEKLNICFKEKEKIDLQITKLITIRDRIVSEINKKIIALIPEDLKKISKQQWQWILERKMGENCMVRYHFCNKIIQQLGFVSVGFNANTNQMCLLISKYGFDAKKIKDGYLIIKDHIASCTIYKGIGPAKVIDVNDPDECDDNYPKIAIDQKGKALYYLYDHASPVIFKDFYKFIDWYEIELKLKYNMGG